YHHVTFIVMQADITICIDMQIIAIVSTPPHTSQNQRVTYQTQMHTDAYASTDTHSHTHTHTHTHTTHTHTHTHRHTTPHTTHTDHDGLAHAKETCKHT